MVVVFDGDRTQIKKSKGKRCWGRGPEKTRHELSSCGGIVCTMLTSANNQMWQYLGSTGTSGGSLSTDSTNHRLKILDKYSRNFPKANVNLPHSDKHLHGISIAWGIPSHWEVMPFYRRMCMDQMSIGCHYILVFLGPNPWHMEIPRPEVQLDCRCYPIPQPQQHQIWATSVTYTTAHGNAGSSTHWAGPGIEPATSWFLVRFISAAPQWELPYYVF